MTRRTNASIAGFALIFYFVAGVTGLALSGRPHLAALINIATSFSALVLGATFYSITRDEDADVAMFAMLCRVLEAIPNQPGEMFFAAGSLGFCWLLLRGRMIPSALAWLGLLASGLLVIYLPLQASGLMGGGANWSSRLTWVIWMPMLIFEMTVAGWFIVKGVAPASRRTA